jgi:hypothetical protein
LQRGGQQAGGGDRAGKHLAHGRLVPDHEGVPLRVFSLLTPSYTIAGNVRSISRHGHLQCTIFLRQVRIAVRPVCP